MSEHEPKPNQPPAEQRPTQEQELSEQQIEKIMRKVQDINAVGTVYHGTKREKMNRILIEGLLPSGETKERRHTARKVWVIRARASQSREHH